MQTGTGGAAPRLRFTKPPPEVFRQGESKPFALPSPLRRPPYQRFSASSSVSFAATQASPSGPISFFQKGARDFR